MWSLFAVSLAAALLAAASAVGLAVSVVRTLLQGGRTLLSLCRFPDAIGYSSITNECPFDPTRIYVSQGGCGLDMCEITLSPDSPEAGALRPGA